MNYDLTSILSAYAQGHYLMANDDGHLAWYTSRTRAIIPLDERFRYPKSLQRVINQNRFRVAIDNDFLGVCYACADRETTWISSELIDIYVKLNKAGYAHSFETWQEDKLAGGILGIVMGGVFIGESMFYHIPEASKVAMVKLVQHLRQRGFVLFDAQLQNSHLKRFGAYEITPSGYQKLLTQALQISCCFMD